MADQRPEIPSPEPGDERAAERFERYLDAVLADGRPSPADVAEGDEAEMARLAAELHAAADPSAGDPDPAFVDQMRRVMRQADAGVAHVREPLPYRARVAEPQSPITAAAPPSRSRIRRCRSAQPSSS